MLPVAVQCRGAGANGRVARERDRGDRQTDWQTTGTESSVWGTPIESAKSGGREAKTRQTYSAGQTCGRGRECMNTEMR